MNKILAQVVMDQIIGTYSGHMAAIPNNPVLFGIFWRIADEMPVEMSSEQKFAATLRAIADAIEAKP